MKETFDLFYKEVPLPRYRLAEYVDGNGVHFWVIQELKEGWFGRTYYADMTDRSKYHSTLESIVRKLNKDNSKNSDRDYRMYEFSTKELAEEAMALFLEDVEHWERSLKRRLVKIQITG